MQGLGSAHNCCSGLESNTDDVVVWLLSGQHGTSGLGVETQFHGLAGFCMESFLQNGSPQTTGCTEFCNFFEYVVVSVPEEGQTTCEFIDLHASFQSCFDVCDTISDGECDFLSSGGACFTDMVAGNGDGVPLRYVCGAVFEDIGDQTHGRFNRENVGAASCVFFQDIVLDGAAKSSCRNALFFSYSDVHSQQYGSRCVDGHGSGNFAEVDAVEQSFHIVEGVDSNAYFTNFASGHFVVGVIADLGWQVECAGQAGAAVSDQVFVTFVGFFSGGESSIHTHGPEFATVHGRLYATGVWIFARESEVSFIVETFEIEWGVQVLVFQTNSFRMFCALFCIGVIVSCKFSFQGFVRHEFIFLLKK